MLRAPSSAFSEIPGVKRIELGRKVAFRRICRRGAPLEVTRGLHVMGRDGGKGGRGRGRRSDDKGGNGRVKMVDREIEALEAAIEVRRRSAADGTAAFFSIGRHDTIVETRAISTIGVTEPVAFVSYH